MGPDPMLLVFCIKRRNLNTAMCREKTGRHTGKRRPGDGREVSMSKGVTRTAGQHPKLEEARKDSHLKPLTAPRHLDFRLQASRSVRQ